MNFENKNVLVVGTGISGIAATELLNKMNAKVILFDGNVNLDIDKVIDKIGGKERADIILGNLPKDVMETLDLVVLSPGVPTDIPLVNELRNLQLPIWGEVELAYQFSKGKIVGITGTNGKTTTTALVGEIMKIYYESVFVVGNIGIPYTQMVSDMNDNSITVAEMSSFQLETIYDFKPDVSAILNITPDHLNRHHTMECYINAKANIFKNQTSKDILVLNYEDNTLRELSKKAKAEILYFSSKRPLDRGIYLEGGNIIYSVDNEKIHICNIHELKILGTHNYENIMAGIAIGGSLNVPMDCIKKAITSFVAVEHRIEYVDEKNGVKYYNDSKGTNPDAAIKGIEAMVTPTLLIGGGYDKNSDYKEWIQSFHGKVKYLVLLGQTREKIAETAKNLGFHNIILVDTLEEAVDVCKEHAKPGDSVLLSPACASWGMFKNYEERGRVFKELVYKL
ncbi:UDP-N-acetylmuramoylalanine--D-glutamate ligase [Mobilisporobacter senegalensis]|uniref:UDP-N-acetylmuramoylalanine--D-glutamate ligase n=1 Tax=Mobilisporobacter senegalensis TaxID=1329262 RepID=A0A3N1XX07_9FIRM|nr:UDP-N-acetylmuramoyl-L-alanine--D-glutamate ligase [Mobilisporobacter senegalensis]ROR30741.1 UDP-N-acetylmuramoylalanine--D-glutamate ligase [Mobilisporobacter senegalensis]